MHIFAPTAMAATCMTSKKTRENARDKQRIKAKNGYTFYSTTNSIANLLIAAKLYSLWPKPNKKTRINADAITENLRIATRMPKKPLNFLGNAYHLLADELYNLILSYSN